jgi:pyruvate dehydrogenase E1 component alpha subunit
MTVTDTPEITTTELLSLYEQMEVIRRTEKAAHDMFLAGLVKGTTHLAAGHEAVAVGASAALRPGDYVFATYRGHHHAIARGASPAECLAELMSRGTGICKAKGGSMHLTKASAGMLGSYAIVGAHLPMAAGAAWSAKLRGSGEVAVAFFGDGATNIGTFHESLNLAQLWQVPAVFVCENNHYAESTPAVQQLPIRDLSKRAVAFGMHSVTVDGQDVEAVYRTAGRALDHARSGKGPVFLLAETYRLVGHYVGDPQVYRPKGELQELRETQDPLDRLRTRLELSDDELEALEREVHELVEASVEFSKAGTDPKPEDALKNIYA